MPVTPPPSRQVTRLLAAWRQGDRAAGDELMPLVYDELHRQARRYLDGERPGHTLQPTALVHEAYLRLVDDGDRPAQRWENRLHFYAAAARRMRQVLVDHARRRNAAKRGGGQLTVALDEARHETSPGAMDLLVLEEALAALERLDPRKARIVELRFFGGLTIDETAAVLEVSAPTVVNETRLARAWLFRQVRGAGSPGGH